MVVPKGSQLLSNKQLAFGGVFIVIIVVAIIAVSNPEQFFPQFTATGTPDPIFAGIRGCSACTSAQYCSGIGVITATTQQVGTKSPIGTLYGSGCASLKGNDVVCTPTTTKVVGSVTAPSIVSPTGSMCKSGNCALVAGTKATYKCAAAVVKTGAENQMCRTIEPKCDSGLACTDNVCKKQVLIKFFGECDKPGAVCEPGLACQSVWAQSYKICIIPFGTQGNEGEPCASNADCKAGLLCNMAYPIQQTRDSSHFFGGKCMSGNAGTLCVGQTDCKEGLVCHSAFDTGKTAYNDAPLYRCEPPGGPSGVCNVCESDTDCAVGFSCMGGTCSRQNPDIGETCSPDKTMCWKGLCNSVLLKCIEPKVGIPCGRDLDCGGAGICNSYFGACTPVGQVGDFCAHDSDCVLGLKCRPSGMVNRCQTATG